MENRIKKLSDKQMYYLLWVTIMNQSQDASKVIKNTKILIERIGREKEYSNLTYDEIVERMNLIPKLHRFPNKMAEYIYDSILTIQNTFSGEIRNVFEEGDVYKNLLVFKGINAHKAEMCLGIIYCLRNNCIDIERFRGCNMSEKVLFEEICLIKDFIEN